MSKTVLSWIEEVEQSFRNDQPVLLRDDTEQSGGCALVFPARTISAEIVNRALHLSRGSSPFVALSAERAETFHLEPMGFNRSTLPPPRGFAPRELVSVEAREGVTTGISAADRARTVRVLGADEPKARDIVKPGHVFPIQTRAGGVLVRSALPEAALDVIKLSRSGDAACFFELYSATGSALSLEEWEQLSKKESLTALTIGDLITARLQREEMVKQITEVRLPTSFESNMKAYLYRSEVHQGDHIALVKGEIHAESEVLTRVHPEQLFEDVFGPAVEDRDEKGALAPTTSLQRALQEVGDAEVGVLVYLRRPDTFPLLRELGGAAHPQREGGEDLPPPSLQPAGAAMKEYGIGAQILRDLGVRKIHLLSSRGAPAAGLANFGLEIIGQRTLGNTKGAHG
ncbi:3,4-dihydroxy-2-butanone-4-phosphate synthase [bacterium]|nr:3,4-dihydroxy-2-butanone-4-phosphate synthase [bacterium]